jgi:hypothetical protein
MNIATHFATGYLTARGLGYDSDRFETFFLGLAALVPDLDLAAGLLIPGVRHGVMSHTILGGSLMAAALAFLSCLLLRGYLRAAQIPAWKLLGLALAGLAIHLILDVFTYGGGEGPNPAHRYFWPVWAQSFHMDYLWPAVRRWHRFLVEILFSAVVASVILAWDVIRDGKNPLHVLSPRRWWAHAGAGGPGGKPPLSLYVYPVILILLGAAYLAGILADVFL